MEEGERWRKRRERKKGRGRMSFQVEETVEAFSGWALLVASFPWVSHLLVQHPGQRKEASIASAVILNYPEFLSSL
jgi:hypothetical protein